MMRYSPVPGSPRRHGSVVAFVKSPGVFYAGLLLLGFSTGYMFRIGTEYWNMYQRIRGAAGHDLTVKHIAKQRPHMLSPPTNSEEVANYGHSVPQAPVAAITAAKVDNSSFIVKQVNKNRPKTPCTKCSLGFCDEPDPNLFTEVSTEIQLFLSLQFPCSGTVTSWKLIDYNPTPGKVVYIDVIRYDHKTDQGTWMGFNTITTNGEAGWVSYDVPVSEQLQVEKDWLVAIHYDDLNGEGVIPHVENSNGGAVKLYDGFGMLMDHQELGRMIHLREPSQVPITAALKQLLVELKHAWRAPALAAVVTPSS